MGFEEFNKLNKDLDKLTSSLYGLSKEKIVQDDNIIDTTKKINDDILNSDKSLKEKFVALYSTIKATFITVFKTCKKKIIDWKLDKALFFLYKIIKTILVFIYYTLPALVLLYAIVQILLFASTHILTLSDKFDAGWNGKFIKSLPLVFQPSQYKFGQLLTTALSFAFGCFLIFFTIGEGKRPWYIQLLLNIVTIAFLTLLYVMPEKINMFMSKLFLIVLLGYLGLGILKAIFSGGSEGNYGSSYNSSSHSHSNTSYSSNNNNISSYQSSSPLPPAKKIPQFTEVYQFGNSVQAKGVYNDGSPYNKAFFGTLVNWTSNSVTVRNSSGYFVLYDVYGAQKRYWK